MGEMADEAINHILDDDERLFNLFDRPRGCRRGSRTPPYVTCKHCGEQYLRWHKHADESWHLYGLTPNGSEIHVCPAPSNVSDFLGSLP